MATTTPNFGWAVPTSTDLVKDGAVAIETLGDSIDASLVDLKGGTTGQVLAKASGTDMDFSWTAIDPLVILDAKGDLITATAADTPARLALGTNGQVLTVDTTTATGLKYATPASGSTFVGVAATAQNQSLAVVGGNQYILSFNTEDYDTDSFHSTSTNTSRLTIPTGKGGKYLVNIGISTDLGTNYAYIYFVKNGSAQGLPTGTNGAFLATIVNVGSNTPKLGGSAVVSLLAGDYIEVMWQNSATGTMNFDARFSASYLGA
jgi:hypothetical protein